MKAALALLVAFAFISAPAPAQAPAPAPGGQPQQQPQAEPGKSSDLKLEDPALSSRPRIRFGPAEQDAGGLPSLGGDARRVEETPPPGSRTSPYPPDTNPGR